MPRYGLGRPRGRGLTERRRLAYLQGVGGIPFLKPASGRTPYNRSEVLQCLDSLTGGGSGDGAGQAGRHRRGGDDPLR